MKLLPLVAALGLAFATPVQALACGGCFGPPTSPTIVTGHRMAFSVSATQTVLWDQFEYEGDPEDFSWVLPVLPGAYVEVAEDAWLSALDAFTSTIVPQPRLNCPTATGGGAVAFEEEGSRSGCGCNDDDEDSASGGSLPSAGGKSVEPAEPPVSVVRKETVGPYDTVVLRSEDPDALRVWLTDHGYVIPEEIEPVIDAYVNEGNDFLALRLSPGVGVKQMQPVRVITPGGDYLLPLRMVAAGVGSLVDVKLFVIAEQRYAMPDIAEVSVLLADLTYDFAIGSSNYLELREAALAQNSGKSYVTSYARQRAFSQPNVDPNFGRNQAYQVAGANLSATTLGALYFAQAAADDGLRQSSCGAQLESLESGRPVVDTCPEGQAGTAGSSGAGGEGSGSSGGGIGGISGSDGGSDGSDDTPCMAAPTGSLASEDLVCGEYSDLATALVGMRPDHVWVTRMEMNLPSTALDADCVVEPAVSQAQVSAYREPTKVENPPCPLASSTQRRRKSSHGGPLAAFALALSLVTRRRGRPR